MQQRRHMFFAADTKRAGPGPAAPARIVDFGARHTLQAIVTACDEHAPIEEQRGSVTKASVSQTAGARPCSGGAIVKLRRRQVIGFIAVPSGGQHFSVQKGCHGKPPTLILHRTRGTPGACGGRSPLSCGARAQHD